jgi:hypothetical protein
LKIIKEQNCRENLDIYISHPRFFPQKVEFLCMTEVICFQFSYLSNFSEKVINLKSICLLFNQALSLYDSFSSRIINGFYKSNYLLIIMLKHIIINRELENYNPVLEFL